MRVRAIVTLVALVLAALVGACKQGAGDVCQVNRDCESPLVCNASTHQCQGAGADEVVDASAPADAAIPPDAAPDADVPDADVPDADVPDADVPDADVPVGASEAGDLEADTSISELR